MTEKKKKPAKKVAPAAAPRPRSSRRAAAPEKEPASAKAQAAPALPPATGVHDLRPNAGATHYRKRVGRGPGSGHGKTAGRGNKGQKSRTGYSHMRGFEGGQMPLHRRLPKRGFTNIFRQEYDPVNLSALDPFEAGQEITPDALRAKGLAGKNSRIKILGDGVLNKAFTVHAHKFSASAREKIEKAGGRCEVIEAAGVSKSNV
jgi:large subunit ribosomal protein L15